MASIGVALFLFCLFVFFGKALLQVLNFRLPVLQSWLIAPTVGFALIEIHVTIFNQALALPVQVFALWTLLGLTLLGASAWAWKKPIVPWPYVLKFAPVLLFSLFYTGWPALLHGFNWFSYVNSDMVYFSAGAVRMLAHPFYSMPSLTDLLGRDYTQATWYSHVVAQVRYGGEMLLAWSAGITRLNPLQAYMPLMLALQLTQLCAATALVLINSRWKRVAFLTAALLSLSPLFSLGTLYQLLPQAGGIPGMLVLFLLLIRQPERGSQAFSYCLLVAVVLSGLCLHYPEVIAFAVLPAFAFLAVRCLRERSIPWLLLGSVLAALPAVYLLIRNDVFAGIVNTLGNVRQAGLTGVTPGESIFPQFMIPSGLANLFGFLPIGYYAQGPLSSVLIAAGLALLLVVAVRTAIDIWRERPYAFLLGLMLLVSLVFFQGANDYGLFKLAMFCQPALAGCLALLSRSAFQRKWMLAAPVVVFLCTAFAQNSYAVVSAGFRGGGVVEVPQVSTLGLTYQVPRICAISDMNLMPAQELAGIVFRISEVLYPSVAQGKLPRNSSNTPDSTDASTGGATTSPTTAKEAPLNSTGSRLRELTTEGTLSPNDTSGHPSIRDRMRAALEAIANLARFPARKYSTAFLPLDSARRDLLTHTYSLWGSVFYEYLPQIIDTVGRPSQLLTLHTEFLINADSQVRDFSDFGLFRVLPLGAVHNWLFFIPSSRGPDYFWERFGAAFYQPERDVYRPGGYMSGIGNFMLLQVLNPSDRLRFRLSLSRTLLGPGNVWLPPHAVAKGQKDVSLHLVGAGSANVVSDPISPYWLDGRAYVALDFKEPSIAFPNDKHGLMRLYNVDFPVDSRRSVGFSRNISAISEPEYEALPRPTHINSFPGELLDPNLEYSGIYEDGWISDQSFVKLGPSRKGETLALSGVVPGLGVLATGQQSLSVQINQGPVHTQILRPGSFKVAVPIDNPAPVTEIHMRFSLRTALPGDDGRYVSALIKSVALQ